MKDSDHPPDSAPISGKDPDSIDDSSFAHSNILFSNSAFVLAGAALAASIIISLLIMRASDQAALNNLFQRLPEAFRVAVPFFLSLIGGFMASVSASWVARKLKTRQDLSLFDKVQIVDNEFFSRLSSDLKRGLKS